MPSETSGKKKAVVLKFGSSVLRNEEDLPRAVHEIYRWWREGIKVFAVVSAFGDTTDCLKSQAERTSGVLDSPLVANLLATGEAASSALLGLTLLKFGIPACVLDSAQAGLRTIGEPLDAQLVSVNVTRLSNAVRDSVVVLPGFVGRDGSGRTTLLGRGGSDYSALFLAQQLGAHCVLVKDVDGLYTSDPSVEERHAARFAKASYESAIRLGGELVQRKAVFFAAQHRLKFTITCLGSAAATEVGPFNDQLDSPARYEPLRISLLGCGTVGGGVYQALTDLRDLFTIVGVGTRTPARANRVGVPSSLITTDLHSLLEEQSDVVVELIGGTGDAAILTSRALQLGRDVVTANKALIALQGNRLYELAQKSGSSLRYSAAVGGVMPAIETIQQVRRHGPIRGFSGVLNATSNFVLDLVATGETFETAVTVAQERGFAEADPRADLDGIDAAQKLAILARAAFDVDLPLINIPCEGVAGLNADEIRRATKTGKITRQVASCRYIDEKIEASVGPVRLPLDHPLANVAGTQNRLLVETESGEQVIVSGQGAGRWPTTEAVIADLLELRVNQTQRELTECVA